MYLGTSFDLESRHLNPHLLLFRFLRFLISHVQLDFVGVEVAGGFEGVLLGVVRDASAAAVFVDLVDDAVGRVWEEMPRIRPRPTPAKT